MIKIILPILMIGLSTGLIINRSVFLIDKKILLIIISLVLTFLIWWLTSYLEEGLNIATWGLVVGILVSSKTSDSNKKKLKRIMYYTMIISSFILWFLNYGEAVTIN